MSEQNRCAHCGDICVGKYCSPRCRMYAQYVRRGLRDGKRVCPICGANMAGMNSTAIICRRDWCKKERKRRHNRDRREAYKAKRVVRPTRGEPYRAMTHQERLAPFRAFDFDPWDTLIIPGAGDGPSPEACPLETASFCWAEVAA